MKRRALILSLIFLVALAAAAAITGRQALPSAVKPPKTVEASPPGKASSRPPQRPSLLVRPAPALPADLSARQANAEAHPNDWLVYGGSYQAWRFSPLTQITKENVGQLRPVWTVPTGVYDGFEASPIVVDGVMYFTTPWNHVFAVNAATGELYWRYVHPLPVSLPLCCGPVNRGAAVGDGKVIFTTLDAHVVALDARTGRPVWQTRTADYRLGYSLTLAPQVIGNKVIIGSSGGDFGARGFVDAYDIRSGRRLWRFWTVPSPGQPGSETWSGDSWKTGGGPMWVTPTYDPSTNLIYAGVGNPGPDLTGEMRKGLNLYTECVIALDADTGRLKWYYQTVPHDVWDLDVVTDPIIDDLTLDGQVRKVVMFPAKSGYFTVLDRVTGEFLYALKYVDKLNWGYVDEKGLAHPDPAKFPRKDRWTTVYPGASGGKEWCPAAYDPRRKRLFIPVIELGHRHKVIRQTFKPGLLYWGGVSEPVPNSGYGHITAIDVEKKKIAWSRRTDFPIVAGVTATASGLVITGTPDQKMLILDADSGKVLWQYVAVSGWHASPVVYAVGGKEYIAFANGWGGWVAGFNSAGTPRLKGVPMDENMYAFALP
ncbi:MAG: pyrroloquinoline quinone-dependent dehydrogenase [Chitinophagales bacterium]